MSRKKIKALPAELVAKIAAGQVVERPVSVVKELVENALDATATDIIIRLEQAGREKIIVQDNGHGMTSAELQLAIQPHTTSKIQAEDDLLSVVTYGFRGEALPSIGRVSTLTVASRPAGETVGHRIVIRQGEVIEEAPIGMPGGTNVTVTHLFSGLPARKKFLKSETTELRHILEWLSHTMLAFPDVRFELYHNGKKVITALPSDKEKRVVEVFGQSSATQLIAFDSRDEHFDLEGFLGKPQTARSTTAKQFLVINDRVVQYPELTRKVKQAYGSLLEAKKQPIFALFVQLPPDMVDVNVHPQKTRVKIHQEEIFLQQLEETVSAVLNKHNLTYQHVEPIDPYDFIFDDPGMDEYLAQALRASSDAWSVSEETLDDTPVLQIHNLYLLKPTANGLIIVDQHAAHERILFQQFKAEFLEERKKNSAVSLPKPAQIELSPAEAEVVKAYQQEMHNLGFTCALEGTTLSVTQVPSLLKNRQIEQLFAELLADLETGRENFRVDSESERTLAYLACRSAIKAGDVLSPKERERLITKLLDTNENYTCPHGRPTHIEITTQALARLFKRK